VKRLTVKTKEPREDKVQQVGEVKQVIESASSTILTAYDKLGVKDASNLRKKLRDSGAQFRVVKNTLFKLAAEGTAIESLTADLAGPTAIATTDGDPVAMAKALVDFARESKGLISIKSGSVDGSIYGADQIQALSKVPPKDVLLAQIVGGLQSPIVGLVGTLQSQIASLVMTLQAVADKQAA
jgi:large subunit ribosomal protein L10